MSQMNADLMRAAGLRQDFECCESLESLGDFIKSAGIAAGGMVAADRLFLVYFLVRPETSPVISNTSTTNSKLMSVLRPVSNSSCNFFAFGELLYFAFTHFKELLSGYLLMASLMMSVFITAYLM